MIDNLISTLVEFPSEENKEKYLTYIHNTEISLLQEAETFPHKSQEYFDFRKKAFSYRRKSATKLINLWVSKNQTSLGCPVSYADTLNIPFQSIKPIKIK
jgi:hypothetical protein